MILQAVAYAVALAIDADSRRQRGEPGVSTAQHNALVEAFKVLGNQVAEHNQALQAMVTQPAEVQRTHWTCYCGWKNAVGDACVVCARSPHP